MPDRPAERGPSGTGGTAWDAAEVMEVMERIAANQRAHERTRSLRKQYRIALDNERLFARIGVKFTPMIMQRPPRGIGQRIVWWWLNRG